MSIFRNKLSKKSSSSNAALDRFALINLVNQAADLLDALQPEQAKKLSLQAIRTNPDCAEAWSNLGYAEIQMGNLDEAEKALTKSISLAPMNPTAWHNLGEAHMRGGNAEKSLECNNRAIVINPNAAVYWLGKGTALAQLEHFDEALACFDKCLALHAQYRSSITDFQLKVMRLNRDVACMLSDPQRKRAFLATLGIAIKSDEEKWKEDVLRTNARKLSKQPWMDQEQVHYHDSFAQINIMQRTPHVVPFCTLNLLLAEYYQDYELVGLCRQRLKEAKAAMGKK